MKFVCLGYYDKTKFAAFSEAEMQAAMEECFAYDDELRRGGHFIGGEALGPGEAGAILRYDGSRTQVTDGPFSETKEHLGGILLLEARDMNHAIALMSRHPGVKFGPWDIRPADETVNKLVAERDARIASEGTLK